MWVSTHTHTHNYRQDHNLNNSHCLPAEIKELSGDIRKFKTALKGFLLEGSFYTLQEYFDRELINK